LRLRQDCHAQRLGFSDQAVSVPSLCEFIETLMKGKKAFLEPQDRDQLLTDAGETIRLKASSLKLQNHEPISSENEND
jgi:hypothetical protein